MFGGRGPQFLFLSVCHLSIVVYSFKKIQSNVLFCISVICHFSLRMAVQEDLEEERREEEELKRKNVKRKKMN